MAIRKNPEQIKEEILETLKEKPLSIEQIRLKVESNWSTVSTYLEELSKEGKVKEIISADKAKIYQRVFGDTYFDIPITDEERKRFRALFSIIIRKYKDANITPNKTQLAKAAVRVIKTSNNSLSGLPVVEYIYGAIPLMIANPSEQYSEEIKLENRTNIIKFIESYIEETKEYSTKKIKERHHVEYCDRLYSLNDDFLKLTESKEWKKEEVFKILDSFFIACPIDEEFKEVFTFTERFISIVRKLSYFDDLEKNRTKILLTFDALWKFIATYKFYKSIENRIPDKDILNLYLGNALFVRKACAEEALSDFYSIYWSKIDNRELKISEKAMSAREIMQGLTGEN